MRKERARARIQQLLQKKHFWVAHFLGVFFTSVGWLKTQLTRFAPGGWPKMSLPAFFWHLSSSAKETNNFTHNFFFSRDFFWPIMYA